MAYDTDMNHPAHRRNTSRRWRRSLGAASLCGLALSFSFPGCQVATPFAGPGYTSADGVQLPGVGASVVVAVTQAKLDSARRAEFDRHTRLIVEDLPHQPGYIGHSRRTRLLGHEVWTLTVWRDDASLDAFVRGPVHREAIRLGMRAVTQAKFLRMDWPTAEAPPSWSVVLQRLEAVEPQHYPSQAARR
jgi:heme-degrading monooxygenase HmoA